MALNNFQKERFNTIKDICLTKDISTIIDFGYSYEMTEALKSLNKNIIVIEKDPGKTSPDVINMPYNKYMINNLHSNTIYTYMLFNDKDYLDFIMLIRKIKIELDSYIVLFDRRNDTQKITTYYLKDLNEHIS